MKDEDPFKIYEKMDVAYKEISAYLLEEYLAACEARIEKDNFSKKDMPALMRGTFANFVYTLFQLFGNPLDAAEDLQEMCAVIAGKLRNLPMDYYAEKSHRL